MMLILDTNVFLRVLVAPVTAEDAIKARQGRALFRAAAADEEQFTTSEAVIAEILFVALSFYKIERKEIAGRLKPLLNVPGCKMSPRNRCLAALDLWATTPRLSYVDALIAIQSHETGYPLATFDQALAKLAGIPVWNPRT